MVYPLAMIIPHVYPGDMTRIYDIWSVDRHCWSPYPLLTSPPTFSLYLLNRGAFPPALWARALIFILSMHRIVGALCLICPLLGIFPVSSAFNLWCPQHIHPWASAGAATSTGRGFRIALQPISVKNITDFACTPSSWAMLLTSRKTQRKAAGER